jgi:hypothetical protein
LVPLYAVFHFIIYDLGGGNEGLILVGAGNL